MLDQVRENKSWDSISKLSVTNSEGFESWQTVRENKLLTFEKFVFSCKAGETQNLHSLLLVATADAEQYLIVNLSNINTNLSFL